MPRIHRRMILNTKRIFSISIFGWELVLLRYPKQSNRTDSQGIQSRGVYIKREGNFLMACDKDGYYISPQRSLTVNDSVSGPSTITVEYFFAGIYEPTPQVPELTEEEKKFVDSVPIDSEDINRKFNHG